MKSALLPTSEKQLGRALKLFKKQPAKTQELSALMDESEKTIGKERVAVTKRIRETLR